MRTVFALNGRADEHAAKLAIACPNVKIVYNHAQNERINVDAAFLRSFDAEIAKAIREGYAVMFHCSCGCHRTGRLAAYYRMKYNGWNVDQATREMFKIGDDMDAHEDLRPQVRAYATSLKGETCLEKPEFCVH